MKAELDLIKYLRHYFFKDVLNNGKLVSLSTSDNFNRELKELALPEDKFKDLVNDENHKKFILNYFREKLVREKDDILNIEEDSVLQYITLALGCNNLNQNPSIDEMEALLKKEQEIIDEFLNNYNYSLKSIQYAFLNSLILNTINSNHFENFTVTSLNDYSDGEMLKVFLGEDKHKFLRLKVDKYFLNALKKFGEINNIGFNDKELKDILYDLYVLAQKFFEVKFQTDKVMMLEDLKTENPIFELNDCLSIMKDEENNSFIFVYDNKRIAHFSYYCGANKFKENLNIIFKQKFPSKYVEIEYEDRKPSLLLDSSNDRVLIRLKVLNEEAVWSMKRVILECLKPALTSMRNSTISIESYMNNINYFLDELAPYCREMDLYEKLNVNNELKSEVPKIVRKKV